MNSIANLYVLATFTLFGYTAYTKFTQSDNYFSAVLTYVHDPTTHFILYNTVLAFFIFMYKSVVWLFFVEPKENEVMKIVEKLKHKIIDLLLFAYIISLEFDFQLYTNILLLVFLFVLHYLAIFRSEFLIHAPSSMSLNLNYRLMGFFVIAFFVDFQIIKHYLPMIFGKEKNVCLFVYYMMATAMAIIQPFAQFAIDFYQKYTLTHFKNSEQFMAYVGVTINLPRLIFQIGMSIWITIQFGFPIFLIFSIIDFWRQLKETLETFTRIRKLTQTMKNLKKISGEELKSYDDLTCMVCFQDISQATLLPCKHLFHEECLRQWIIKNANHFCPKCKRPFNFQNPNNFENVEPRHQQNHVRRDIRQQVQAMAGRFNENIANIIQKEKKKEKPPKNQQNFQSHYEQVHEQHFTQREQAYIPQQKLDQPYEFYEQKRRELIKIGSLPFRPPTPAVSFRKIKHMRKHNEMAQSNDILLNMLSLSKQNQILLLI